MRLFPLLAIAALVLILIWWIRRTPPQQVARIMRHALLWVGGALLIFLAATGRLHWLFALLAAAVPFVQRLMRILQLMPMLQRILAMFHTSQAAAGPSMGQSSQVRTRFLRMHLDHDSGDLSGEVLEGPFAGRQLSILSLSQLLQLLDACRAADAQSAAVLEAYLERHHGTQWREQDTTEAPGQGQNGTDPMSRDQAYEILGLEPGAERQGILEAHRRLMQKLHPDRGGSTWLASRVNQAKDLLLKP